MLDAERALLCRDTPIHMEPPPGFQGQLYQFQKQDVGYHFFMRRSLNANMTGLGKTIISIALNCLQKAQGKLKGHIQVVPAQSLLQWYSEYRKFAPHLLVRLAIGDKSQRVNTYQLDFDVLLISYHVLWRDWEYILQTDYNSINFDEASFFRHSDTKTFDFVTRLSEGRDFTMPMSATPIQTCVTDLWSVFQVLHMPRLLGTKAFFTNRYCVINPEITYHQGKRKMLRRIVGYKNMDELTAKISPFYVRRRVIDVEQELPQLIVQNKWLNLLPDQQRVYDDVKHDVVSHSYRGTELRNRFHMLKKTIDGLQTLDEHNNDISIKADIIMDLLTGDLSEEKVIIFCSYKASIRSLCTRLSTYGIKYALLWGDEPDQAARFRIQQQFFDDKSLKVILGTTALEMSLNLQAARYLICHDLLYNPARVAQIIGRIRRIGSPHKTNIILNLLCTGTIEEKLWDRLNRRQAVSDYVFDEKSEIFDELTDDELLTLIKG